MSEKQDEKEVISKVDEVENIEIKKVLKNTKLKSILKNFGGFLVGLFVGLMIMGLGTMRIFDENRELKTQDEGLNSQNEYLKSQLDEAQPWFDMKDEEKRKVEEKNAKVEAEKKAEEEKKEEEDRLAKEEQEKNKYNTELSYDEIARNPEQTLLKDCKFKGEVVQVLEGDGTNNLRVAINGDYDKMMLVEYDPSILDSRVLEKDNVTLYGKSAGTTSYTSTMGQKITIPAISADKIDIN
ncbi:hypothetical protein UT300009_34690 [Paraclostridium bifermentans]